MRVGLVIGLLAAASFARADLIDGEDFVDPTKPFYFADASDTEAVAQVFRAAVAATYEISFIRAGGESSFAVINSVRVSVGDVVGDAEVLEIDREGVVLLIDDEEQRISMYENRIKSAR